MPVGEAGGDCARLRLGYEKLTEELRLSDRTMLGVMISGLAGEGFAVAIMGASDVRTLERSPAGLVYHEGSSVFIFCDAVRKACMPTVADDALRLTGLVRWPSGIDGTGGCWGVGSRP